MTGSCGRRRPSPPSPAPGTRVRSGRCSGYPGWRDRGGAAAGCGSAHRMVGARAGLLGLPAPSSGTVPRTPVSVDRGPTRGGRRYRPTAMATATASSASGHQGGSTAGGWPGRGCHWWSGGRRAATARATARPRSPRREPFEGRSAAGPGTSRQQRERSPVRTGPHKHMLLPGAGACPGVCFHEAPAKPVAVV
jgi:hypothetical protein